MSEWIPAEIWNLTNFQMIQNKTSLIDLMFSSSLFIKQKQNMQQSKDEEEECWNTKNTPVTDLEVWSQVTPVQAQGCTSDSNQSWRSPFSSAIELLKSRRIWPSVDNAVAVVIAPSSSLWSKIRRMMMIMIAFMISSSKLTVVAVEQYLHDLIIFFFFFLPPLKQAKLVLVMEMRLFTQNPIITTTCGAQ